jgi:hypothetical protein
MSLTDAVATALQSSGRGERQHRVHDVVARQLDSISPGATVKATEYFNHAWIPDLVVAGRDGQERDVFLRFQVFDESFDDDLEHLGDRDPLFLDLSVRSEQETQHQDFDLSGALKTRNADGVLVTEIDAIDRFGSGVRENQTTAVATKEVVVGGRGVIDPPSASAIVKSWRDAREGAADASSDRVRSALDEVEVFLDRISSLDLEAELRGTWVAAGHDAEAFPGSEDWELRDRSPEEIAHLVASVLGQGRETTEQQWSDIGEAISATSLGHELSQLDHVYVGGLVNDMVRANLARWTAKYAYVPALDSDSLTDQFDWRLGKYSLALNLIRRVAYFTDIGVKWNRMPKAKRLPDVRDRLQDFDGRDVLGVGIETPEENVSHALRSTATRSLGEHLAPFVEGETGWRAARLRWLELRVPGTDLMAKVDFSRNVIQADASIPLETFAKLVGRYVVPLTPDEMERLTGAFRTNDSQ